MLLRELVDSPNGNQYDAISVRELHAFGEHAGLPLGFV